MLIVGMLVRNQEAIWSSISINIRNREMERDREREREGERVGGRVGWNSCWLERKNTLLSVKISIDGVNDKQ